MSDLYPIHPTEADLDDESLAKQQADEFRCQVVGAHRWITVCSCCGKQQSKFYDAEYLEVD